jgi:hypothetical protein
VLADGDEGADSRNSWRLLLADVLGGVAVPGRSVSRGDGARDVRAADAGER